MKASEIVISYKKAKEIQYQPKLLLEIIFNNKNFFIRKNSNLIKENRTTNNINIFFILFLDLYLLIILVLNKQ